MPEPLVIESPAVGVLMDIGQTRIGLEKEAKEAGLNRFGEGYHDFIGSVNNMTKDDWGQMAAGIVESDPEAWAAIVRASLMMVQASESPGELRQNLKHHGALVVAWLEDLDGRSVVGSST